MNCEKFQSLISAYIDGELEAQDTQNVKTHISVCAECAKLHEDFAAILGFCDETFAEDSVPPNSQALWCRINNIIETEIKPEIETEKAKKIPQPNWFQRLLNSEIRFSASQMAASVFGIALLSSLLTIVGIKNFSASGNTTLAETEKMQPSVFEKVLVKLGVAETPEQKIERHLKERQKAIDYWRKRVEVQRASWDIDTRKVFDRNLNVIDKTVSEYTLILQSDPTDKISTEMLDSALNEKMELLREFSEL